MAVLSEIPVEETSKPEDVIVPERPPQSIAGHADPWKEFDRMPLFMQTLPPELGGRPNGSQPQENATLDALASLMYDGDPSEIADGFKEQANDLFKKKRFKDAITFYTRAIDEVGPKLPIEEQRVLWCNRAAANLELQNYGKTLKDVSLVLAATVEEPPSPKSIQTTMKAHLRASRALYALDKLPEALDSLDRLRQLEEGTNDVGLEWRKKVEKRIEDREKRQKEIHEREFRGMELEKAMRNALAIRGLILPRPKKKTDKLFADCPTDITPPHFDPDGLSTTAGDGEWTAPGPISPLIFPVFLLSPLSNPPKRDLCMSLHEYATFGDLLESMSYDPESIVYISTFQKKVLKIGKKMSLQKVFEGLKPKTSGAVQTAQNDGLMLIEGWALEMVVVPKGKEGEEWVEEWKSQVKEGAKPIL